jgi:hypothetical protein
VSVQEIELDVEELCELRYMAVRPHVQEVMNDLIRKLTQEVKVLKTNREKLIDARPKWSEIVAGAKKRSEVLTHSSAHSMSTNTTKISKVPGLPIIRNRIKFRNQMLTANADNLKTVKCQDKPKHKIVLIGDSHARGCASKLQGKLDDNYEVLGYVKPGAGASVLTKTAQTEINGLTAEDTLIYWGGTYDIAKNNTSGGIKHIHHYLLENRHTNIIFTGAPHRYDLNESSIINEESRRYNEKLTNISSKYRHTSVMEMNLGREDFTRHGLHLRNSGRNKLLAALAEKIKTQQCKSNGGNPIGLTWKEDTLEESHGEKHAPKTVLQTLPSKRQRKNPTTRSSDFLWG